MRTAYRIYGTLFRVDPERMERLREETEFEHLELDGTTLDVEHESDVWMDTDAAAEALSRVLAPDGSGGLDVIDNPDWTITRYTITPGKVTSFTRSVDDVLAPHLHEK